MKKLDDGYDIFKNLDEYLKNPEAFGKPSAETLLSLPLHEKTLDRKAKCPTYSIPEVVRTNWVKLSHLVRTGAN
jgi:hypothetical protein